MKILNLIWTVVLLVAMIGLMIFVGWIGIDYLIIADTQKLKALEMVLCFAWLAFTLFLVGFAAMSWSGYRYSKSEMKDAYYAGQQSVLQPLVVTGHGKEMVMGFDPIEQSFEDWFEQNHEA